MKEDLYNFLKFIWEYIQDYVIAACMIFAMLGLLIFIVKFPILSFILITAFIVYMYIQYKEKKEKQ